MAIIISQAKKEFNWIPFLIVGILLVFIIAGSYFLFFTEVPFIEYIAPSSQETISDISTIKSEQFKSDLDFVKTELQGKTKQGIGGPVSSGSPINTQGKSNPFVSF